MNDKIKEFFDDFSDRLLRKTSIDGRRIVTPTKWMKNNTTVIVILTILAFVAGFGSRVLYEIYNVNVEGFGISIIIAMTVAIGVCLIVHSLELKDCEPSGIMLIIALCFSSLVNYMRVYPYTRPWGDPPYRNMMIACSIAFVLGVILAFAGLAVKNKRRIILLISEMCFALNGIFDIIVFVKYVRENKSLISDSESMALFFDEALMYAMFIIVHLLLMYAVDSSIEREKIRIAEEDFGYDRDIISEAEKISSDAAVALTELKEKLRNDEISEEEYDEIRLDIISKL